MNDSNSEFLSDKAPATGKGELSFLSILLVLAKHKRLVIGLPLVSAIVAAGLTLTMPDIYQADTKLLPPQQAQSGAAALLSQLGGAAGAAAGAAGIKNPNDLYVGMLRSRTVADKIIARYNLKQVYELDSTHKTRKMLEKNTIVSAGKDGLITIFVEDKDKKLVAAMANSYVDELLTLTKTLAVTEASQRRLFYERQLEQAKSNLASAEKTLKRGLGNGGVISVDGESRAMVEMVGRLRAQVSAKEIQLNSMQAFVTATNPKYKLVVEELSSLRGELARLENGRPGAARDVASEARQPGLENIRTLRDVKYNEMLYELLARQYELARLDEAREGSIIQVLDRAVEPEQKTKPLRAMIVFMTAMLAFFAAVAIAFVVEAKNAALRDPKRAARVNELRAQLRW